MPLWLAPDFILSGGSEESHYGNGSGVQDDLSWHMSVGRHCT